MAIRFYFEEKIQLNNRRALRKLIELIFKWENRGLESLNFIFCSDNKLLKINQQFLNHDYYTDIITFELTENPVKTNGEIYISVDRVKDNSGLQKTSLTEELHRVIFHGVLHLCGYKDKTSAQKEKMRSMENKYLALYKPK